ncbi:H(+)/Cl(-) exchange transporter ClcA [Methylocapsa acidiphila]|uniref:H(+)/Cl(-) exchange transporter ClcA n=1 Tax=Methylocapsa acidiphila TaxID=133552 RepID=UPI000423A506|nr:H(+)/Cl(-) exchange transporter ClcA [Methylocapsa acidiphila]
MDAIFGSDSLPFAIAATALALGLCLFLLILRRALTAKSLALRRGTPNSSRLSVGETLEIDSTRRLVVIRRDNAEHLIMIGAASDLLLEHEIFEPRRNTEGTRGEVLEAIRAKILAQDANDVSSPALPDAESDAFPEAPPAPRAASEEPSRSFREDRINPRASARALEKASVQARRAVGRGLTIGSGLIPLALLAGAAGAGAGLIGGLFRLALRQASHLRSAMPLWWSDAPLLGFGLIVVGAAVATALAVWLVRRFMEHAAGSGIPQIEAVIGGELPPPSLLLLPIKFIGGVLAIGSGLALGREGPSVQMGATLADALGKAFGRNPDDRRSLIAAGAGAGLAAAFNAPLSGSAFVLEELIRRFDPRDAIAALGAAGSAIVMAQLLTGPAPAFTVADLPYPEPADNLLSFALGAVAGALGVIYSRVLLGALAAADRLTRWPPELRGALLGAAVGALAWFAPRLAGDGEQLIQQTLDGAYALSLIPLLYLLRLGLGAASYSSGAPGGIFAPLLVLGAQMGYFFGGLWHPAGVDPAAHAVSFAIVGMAALFSAVVRAPLTGIILVTEMTQTSNLLLPMLAACFSAMATASILGEPPIYDSLKARIVKAAPKTLSPI